MNWYQVVGFGTICGLELFHTALWSHIISTGKVIVLWVAVTMVMIELTNGTRWVQDVYVTAADGNINNSFSPRHSK